MMRTIGQWALLTLFIGTLSLGALPTISSFQAPSVPAQELPLSNKNPLPEPIPNGMCTSSSDCPPGMICKRGMCVVPF